MKSCLSEVGKGFTEEYIGRRIKPKATHVLIEETGKWISWEALPFYNAEPANKNNHVQPFEGQVHAVKFEDGSVWDCINGWR